MQFCILQQSSETCIHPSLVSAVSWPRTSIQIKIYHLFLSAPRLINIVCDLTSLIIMIPIMGHNQYLCALNWGCGSHGLYARIQQPQATGLHTAAWCKCSTTEQRLLRSMCVFPVVKIQLPGPSDFRRNGNTRTLNRHTGWW